MASSCDIYKGGIKLGSGTCAAGSANITSYTGFIGDNLAHDVARTCARRNVTVVITQVGSHQGKSWRTRVLTEAATTVLKDACPFIGA